MRSCDEKVECPICKRKITKINITKHLRSHKNHPERQELLANKYHLDHTDLFCKYCGKECKNTKSLVHHELRCAKNPNRLKSPAPIKNFNNKGRTAWNKGLTKETNASIMAHSIALSKKLRGRPGRKHTEEEKRKISEARRKYLKDHPDQVPYLLSHSSRESYPEIYFKGLFEAENIHVIYHYSVGLYQLDFCSIDKKLDIEIDGEQHYVDKRIVERDIKRTADLEQLGWKIYRIRWAYYVKLNLKEKHEIIDIIRRLLGD